jgi:uncharacterized protein
MQSASPYYAVPVLKHNRRATSSAQPTLPRIIDMHLHAMPVTFFGSPPGPQCAPFSDASSPADTAAWDPRTSLQELFAKYSKKQVCADALWPPATDDDLMKQTIEILQRRNIVAVTSGPPEFVFRWKAAAPSRIIPAIWGSTLSLPLESLRTWFREGSVAVLGELTPMFEGLAPGDSVLEPYLALAEESDVPVGIHMGAVLVGGHPRYRAKLGSPLLLEDVLDRHPKLRVYVMHAGWPMLDEMLAILYTYPHVYVDIGYISFALPLPEFHHYLQRLVEAGVRHRVMFGSDQMIWPQAIEHSIKAIESASFLTEQQRRDIFYNNAARFLRLNEPNKAR